jgi:hypothetical protein
MTLISPDRLKSPNEREHDIGEASAIRYFERVKVFREISAFLRGKSKTLKGLNTGQRKGILEELRKHLEVPKD